MVQNIRPASIGEVIVSANPDDVLVTYGLGSCVVVCLYDPSVRVGGMLHALLPALTSNHSHVSNPAKFVDQGVPLLIDSLVASGAMANRLIANLAGGAQIIGAPEYSKAFHIGASNVQAAEAALRSAGLKIKARAVGGSIGRTVKLYIAGGQTTVRILGQTEQAL